MVAKGTAVKCFLCHASVPYTSVDRQVLDNTNANTDINVNINTYANTNTNLNTNASVPNMYVDKQVLDMQPSPNPNYC